MSGEVWIQAESAGLSLCDSRYERGWQRGEARSWTASPSRPMRWSYSGMTLRTTCLSHVPTADSTYDLGSFLIPYLVNIAYMEREVRRRLRGGRWVAVVGDAVGPTASSRVCKASSSLR